MEEVVEDEVELTPAARAVEEALRGVCDASDGRADALESVLATSAASRRAAEAVSVGDAADDGPLATVVRLLGEARTEAQQAEDACAKLPHKPQVEGLSSARIMASVETPTLHRIERTSLVPTFRIATAITAPEPPAYEPLPAPETFEDLESYGKRASEHIRAHLDAATPDDDQEEVAELAPAAAEPHAEETFVAQWARECFDEVAMIGSQREPLLGDDWRTTEELELRMLTALDGFASLGPGALSSLEALVLDAPAPDPALLFAAGLLCCSHDGRDALGMAERLARACARDPEALSSFGDALAMSPHPQIDAMLRSWLSESDPSYREVATRVLSSRLQLTPTEQTRCAEDRPEIAAHVLVPMALGKHPDAERLLLRALEADHAGLRQAAWLALALESRNRAAEKLRAELDGDHGAAASSLLAAVGGRDDVETLTQRALRDPSATSFAAVAVAGSLEVIDGLIGLLRHDDQDIALGAARALDRITGANLIAKVELAPDKLMAPDLPEPNTGGLGGPPAKALARLVSDPRHAPSDGSPDTLELPAPDHAAWTAWWQQNRERFDVEQRHRRGQPFTPLIGWGELAGPSLSFDERCAAANELLVLTKHDAGFDARALVSRQRLVLNEWRSHAERASYPAVGWPS